jgi:hypothetical protein
MSKLTFCLVVLILDKQLFPLKLRAVTENYFPCTEGEHSGSAVGIYGAWVGELPAMFQCN